MIRSLKVAVAAALIASLTTVATAQPYKDGAPPPQFECPDFDGKMHKLSDYKGKVVLLDFWATWCGPCKAVMAANLKPLHEKYGKKGLVIMGLSNEPVAKQKPFVDQMGYHWLKLVDNGGNVARQYGVRGIPTLVLIGRDGNVAIANGRDWPKVEAYLAANCTKEEKDEGAARSDLEVKRRLDRDVAVNVEGSTVGDVMSQIAGAANVEFALPESLAGKPVTMAFNGKAEDALKQLCELAGLEFKVDDKKVVLAESATPAEPEPPAVMFPKGTPEYERLMSLLGLLVSSSHRALKAESGSAAVEALSSRDKGRLEEMVRYKLDRANGDEAEQLKALKALFKD